MNTLEENLKCPSPKHQNREKQARELYKAIGTPTSDDLKAMIWINLIKKNMVTMDGVHLDKNLMVRILKKSKAKLQ